MPFGYLSRFFFFFNYYGARAVYYGIFRDDDFAHRFIGRRVKHCIKHTIFHYRSKSAGAGFELYGLMRYRFDRVRLKGQVNAVHFHQLDILFDKRVFGLSEYIYERSFIQRRQADRDGYSADKFGYKPIFDKILRLHLF